MEHLALVAKGEGINHEITFSFQDIIKKQDILQAKMLFLDILQSRLNLNIRSIEVVINFENSKGLILNALAGKTLENTSSVQFVN